VEAPPQAIDLHDVTLLDALESHPAVSVEVRPPEAIG